MVSGKKQSERLTNRFGSCSSWVAGVPWALAALFFFSTAWAYDGQGSSGIYLNAAGIASLGPMPIISGGTPRTAKETNLASGVKLNCFKILHIRFYNEYAIIKIRQFGIVF